MIQIRCLIKIDDSAIVRICNRDRKKYAARNPLIGAHIAKCSAIRHRLSRVNLNMDYARVRQWDGEYQNK